MPVTGLRVQSDVAVYSKKSGEFSISWTRMGPVIALPMTLNAVCSWRTETVRKIRVIRLQKVVHLVNARSKTPQSVAAKCI